MKTVTINLPNGYTVRAVENTKSILAEIWDAKIYERDLIRITPGMTVLDIGANQGFYSLYAAGQGARVFSVEPENKNFALLTENINANGLGERVTAFHCAIARREGRLDLYLHDFDEEMASAIVTTTPEFLENIKRKNERVRVQKTDCHTLETILGKIAAPRIDVLKIDCEGAEMDILESAPREAYARIRHIVMETHSNYPPKDMVFLVNRLGFNVIGYDKIADPTGTGYLFAENKKTARHPVWRQAVADLRVPPFIGEDASLLLDGSNSFSTEGAEARLSHAWKMDGMTIGNGAVLELNAPVSRPGAHEIELIVSDDGGQSDRKKNIVWILDKNYFADANGPAFPLEHAAPHLAAIDGTQSFFCFFPKDWDASEISFSFDYVETGDFKAVFQFNGDLVPLTMMDNVISLARILPGFAVRFSLSSPRKEKLKIKWWCNRESEPDNGSTSLAALRDKYPGAVVLTEGAIGNHRFSGDMTFLIRRELFPSNWEPENLCIKIGTIENFEGAVLLHGQFISGDLSLELADWNTLIKLEYGKIDKKRDFIFRTVVQSKLEIMQVQFWFE